MKILFNVLMIFAVVGFMSSCSEAPEGKEVKTEDEKKVENKEEQAEAKVYSVNTEESTINWEATKTGGGHNGTIDFKSGSVKVKGDKLVGGNFVLDMTSITVTDLKEGEGKKDLEEHLTATEFFDVANHKEATFEITNVTAKEGENGTTHEIEGNLTMKGVTNGVTIPATVTIAEGMIEASTPQFTIDRQDWNVNYKSAKDIVINDKIGLKINLKANATEG